MPGILFDQSVPGATTCIVVGPLGDVRDLDFARYRAVLWWIETRASKPLPPGLTATNTQIAPIENAASVDISGALERFVRLDPRHLPSLIISDALAGALSKNYDRVISAVHSMLESTHRSRMTRQKDGFTWQKHILRNAPSYVQSRLPDAWANALRGLPAIVCGSGPSLDVSINKLVAAANQAVVFSADSALRALARHGVAADFAVSIDAAKIPEKCLPPDSPPRRVVLASISPPGWQDAISPTRRFFLSGNQLTDDWLATFGTPRTAIRAIESCGSTAIELAAFLGCDPIYLFGLDLAVDPANPARRHQHDADPGLYGKSNYDPTANLPRVPGNYADTVPCFALGDWRELDHRLAGRTAPRIFNVNDRGARLRGTTLVHPEKFFLTAAPGAKDIPLAALPGTVALPKNPGALSRLSAAGRTWQEALPGLHRELSQNGPVTLANAFRPLVLDPEYGRALGAFALKLMPHLVPPIEGDHTFWQTLLGEFEDLAALAAGIENSIQSARDSRATGPTIPPPRSHPRPQSPPFRCD